MNPSLPLTGNSPHAAQMPVRPRGAVGPPGVLDASPAETTPSLVRLSKARRDAALSDALLMMVMVAIGVVLGLAVLFVSRY